MQDYSTCQAPLLTNGLTMNVVHIPCVNFYDRHPIRRHGPPKFPTHPPSTFLCLCLHLWAIRVDSFVSFSTAVTLRAGCEITPSRTLRWFNETRMLPRSLLRTPGPRKTTNQRTNQPINKPSKQATNLPTNQSSKQPTDQPTNQPISKPSNQATNLSTNQSSEQPTNQPTTPTNQPINQPTNQINQPANQPISKLSNLPTTPTNQPTDQPIDQPINQPTNQTNRRTN